MSSSLEFYFLFCDGTDDPDRALHNGLVRLLLKWVECMQILCFITLSMESFRVNRSRTRAGTVSDLLHDLTCDLYIKYYQTRQIGVGPRMDFQQIGTVDTE